MVISRLATGWFSHWTTWLVSGWVFVVSAGAGLAIAATGTGISKRHDDGRRAETTKPEPVVATTRRIHWAHADDIEFVTVQPGAEFRMPAEFERQQMLVLAAGNLGGDHARVVAEISAAIDNNLHIVVLVNSKIQREAIEQQMDSCLINRYERRISLLRVQHNSQWVRDFGPTVLATANRQKLVDWMYGDQRPADDLVPSQLALLSHTPVNSTTFEFEGGNLLSNGQGLILTTSRVLDQNGQPDQEVEIASRMAALLNAEDLVLLEPLYHEGTGHVDMFATFTAPDTVVIGQCDPKLDPENAEILDRNAELLSGLMTRQGPLKVERIPMEDHRDGLWRTYTNVIFANGTLIVPTYEGGSQRSESDAIRLYRRLLPDWKVVTVDASSLIQAGGALHCASLNLFRLDADLMPTPLNEFPGDDTENPDDVDGDADIDAEAKFKKDFELAAPQGMVRERDRLITVEPMLRRGANRIPA